MLTVKVLDFAPSTNLNQSIIQLFFAVFARSFNLYNKEDKQIVQPNMKKTVNLIYKAALNRTTGLEQDAEIIQQLLQSSGYKVNHYKITERRIFKKLGIPQSLTSKIKTYLKTRGSKFGINIFLEKIRPEFLGYAEKNILIPNHEMFSTNNVHLLEFIDCVLCKTKYAQKIFSNLGCNSKFISFSSKDNLNTKIRKNYNHFLHLAGKSSYRRGTNQILDLWKNNFEFPKLTVIARQVNKSDYKNCHNIEILDEYVTDEVVLDLQNRCGVHLCLSEAEGFGHFIVEGLSCGASIVTTNGQPMNELVQSDRGYLVECSKIQRKERYLHDTFYFDPLDLKKKVFQVIEDTQQEKNKKSTAARKWFEDNNKFFQENFISMMLL